jgi:dynactin 1
VNRARRSASSEPSADSIFHSADYYENQFRDECDRNVDLEEALLDAQSTIGQFRDLVLSMQTCVSPVYASRDQPSLTIFLALGHSEMDSLRQLHESQITETAALSIQSQTVINMNLRLQSSATKAQAKAIDMELQKLDATQALEHLAIVRVRSHQPAKPRETELC